jgi:hypothetical protein
MQRRSQVAAARMRDQEDMPAASFHMEESMSTSSMGSSDTSSSISSEEHNRQDGLARRLPGQDPPTATAAPTRNASRLASARISALSASATPTASHNVSSSPSSSASTTEVPARPAGRKRAKQPVPSPNTSSCSSSSSSHPQKKLKTGAPKEEDPEDDSSKTCCICMDVPELKDAATVNGCAHIFCFGCIEKWADRENTCPLCKVRFGKIDRIDMGTHNTRKRSTIKKTKRVKNRDQRADHVTTGIPLQGLFARMESSGNMPGSMPHTLAQLIFSGLVHHDSHGPLRQVLEGSRSGGFPLSASRSAGPSNHMEYQSAMQHFQESSRMSFLYNPPRRANHNNRAMHRNRPGGGETPDTALVIQDDSDGDENPNY